MEIMKKRAALYLRVSTGQQTTDNQRPDLIQLAKARGFEIVALFEETISAAKARPAYDKMLLSAHRGEFEALLIWSLDRFGRSLVGNLQAVVELDRIGVQIVSVREPWLDTSGPVRGLLVAIFSWCAEQERVRLIERTRAGLDRARRQGKRIGRPPVSIDPKRALAMRGQGMSIRQVALALGVGSATLHRALRVHEAVPQPPPL
jgi:putative DNA-invertase from lambdoid prophage Rac